MDLGGREERLLAKKKGTVGTNCASRATNTVVLVARSARIIGTVGIDGVSHATETVGMFHTLDACRGLFLQTNRVGPNGVEKSLLDDQVNTAQIASDKPPPKHVCCLVRWHIKVISIYGGEGGERNRTGAGRGGGVDLDMAQVNSTDTMRCSYRLMGQSVCVPYCHVDACTSGFLVGR